MHPLVLYVAIVRQVQERNTMRVTTTSTVAALITMLMTAHAAAQTAPQIIIVDGVKYQALPTTVSAPAPNPYAFPALVAAPITVTPVTYPVQTSQPVSVSVPSNYEVQTVHPVANVVVPVIATAIGVWALSQFFRPERGYGYGRAHGHGHAHGNHPVSVQRPVVPVWVPPAHGGHHPR
jgi:hypothetical protein